MRNLARTIRALLVLPLLAAPLPAFADPYTDTAAIDELFAELRTAGDALEANEISQQIWDLWFSPSDPELANRMNRSSLALATGDVTTSLLELTSIVTDYPDYAEGWNQRATLYFMLDNLEASLADIDKVLAIEPRHYGALAGRVLIYLKQGKHDEALRDMRAALALHPYLNERRLFPELAEDVTHV
jgi:tetratricopeptide (TPR) repeat protein